MRSWTAATGGLLDVTEPATGATLLRVGAAGVQYRPSRLNALCVDRASPPVRLAAARGAITGAAWFAGSASR